MVVLENICLTEFLQTRVSLGWVSQDTVAPGGQVGHSRGLVKKYGADNF